MLRGKISVNRIAEHAKFYKVVLGSRRTPIFTESMQKLLKESFTSRLMNLGSDSYLEKAGIRIDMAERYYTSALIGIIVEWLRSDMPYTPLFLAKQFFLLSRPHGAADL